MIWECLRIDFWALLLEYLTQNKSAGGENFWNGRFMNDSNSISEHCYCWWNIWLTIKMKGSTSWMTQARFLNILVGMHLANIKSAGGENFEKKGSEMSQNRFLDTAVGISDWNFYLPKFFAPHFCTHLQSFPGVHNPLHPTLDPSLDSVKFKG